MEYFIPLRDFTLFTENFLYYIDFFGWEMMIEEGKKAPGQYLNFVLKVCCYNGFDAKSVKLYSYGRVGIGSLFLNLLSCKSVSNCRLLPALPALLLPPGYLLQKKYSCSRLFLLHAAFLSCSACCSALLLLFCLRAMWKFCLLACYKKICCCCTDFFCPFPLVLDLLLPGFVAKC